MTYIIENGVPIPAGYRTRGINPEGAAVRALEPGQSVVLPTKRGRQAVSYEFTQSKAIGKPKYFITRSLDKETIRVWRVLGAPEPSDEEGIL